MTRTARFALDPAFTVGTVDPRLFGSFVEHLGRCVYTGIFEPDHPTADEAGLRQDVLELVRELGVTVIRYPGGNFVSGYKWEDSVGPADERPRRLDLAWRTTESNRFGLSEYIAFLKKVGPQAEPMMAVNLGTRGVAEAIELQEYANHPAGTELSDRRIAHGDKDPFGIRLWCLGNEMDGPWQTGHKTAEEYGRLAAETARAMRQIDKDVELVACGSSGQGMDTFAEWEATVLQETYDLVDHISLHAYYEEHDGDRDSFLASAVDMESFIENVVATCDHVGARLKSKKKINLSFDEWNVWYMSRTDAEVSALDWPEAPPPGGRLLGHRRGRPRFAPDRPAPPRGPRHGGLPGPTRQRHRPDHDRARWPGLAPDDVLPVRGGVAVRARRGPRRTRVRTDVRHEAPRHRGPAARHGGPRGGRHGHRLRGQPQSDGVPAARSGPPRDGVG